MTLRKRDVERALQNKLGCRKKQSHHTFYEFIHEGKSIARTHLSQGRHSDINDWLISKMAKQLKVSKPFFIGLVNCSHNLENYIEELRSNNLLPG